ncbi:class I SAM-dependent methyltransferase [Patescibacteria group bacterium]
MDICLSGRQKKWKTLLPNLKDKVILDVGCSYGWLEEIVLEAGCKEIWGIEPDGNNLKDVRKKYPQAHFKKGSVFNLSFADNTFDIVALFDVIEHIPRGTEHKALVGIRRVLKKNGTLCLSTPHQNILSNALDPAWYLGHRHYSTKRIIELLTKSGFTVTFVDYGGGLASQLYMILFYLYKFALKRDMHLFEKRFNNIREREYLSTGGYVTLFIKANAS